MVAKDTTYAEALMPPAQAWWCSAPGRWDDDGLAIGDQQVIQYWERPVMETMGQVVARNGGHVLEIGFGLGMSARAIGQGRIERYTVIEAHPEIARRAQAWAKGLPVPATVMEGFWQNLVNDLPAGSFDGILFDTCPIDESERDIWYRAFIPHAGRLLRPGGIFTYYAHQAAPAPLRDQWLLARHFSTIQEPIVVDVTPTQDCQYWQQSTLLVPVIYR